MERRRPPWDVGCGTRKLVGLKTICGLRDDVEFTRDDVDLRTCGLRDVWTRRRCKLGLMDSETCGLWEVCMGLGDLWTRGCFD